MYSYWTIHKTDYFTHKAFMTYIYVSALKLYAQRANIYI